MQADDAEAASASAAGSAAGAAAEVHVELHTEDGFGTVVSTSNQSFEPVRVALSDSQLFEVLVLNSPATWTSVQRKNTMRGTRCSRCVPNCPHFRFVVLNPTSLALPVPLRFDVVGAPIDLVWQVREMAGDRVYQLDENGRKANLRSPTCDFEFRVTKAGEFTLQMSLGEYGELGRAQFVLSLRPYIHRKRHITAAAAVPEKEDDIRRKRTTGRRTIPTGYPIVGPPLLMPTEDPSVALCLVNALLDPSNPTCSPTPVLCAVPGSLLSHPNSHAQLVLSRAVEATFVPFNFSPASSRPQNGTLPRQWGAGAEVVPLAEGGAAQHGLAHARADGGPSASGDASDDSSSGSDDDGTASAVGGDGAWSRASSVAAGVPDAAAAAASGSAERRKRERPGAEPRVRVVRDADVLPTAALITPAAADAGGLVLTSTFHRPYDSDGDNTADTIVVHVSTTST